MVPQLHQQGELSASHLRSLPHPVGLLSLTQFQFAFRMIGIRLSSALRLHYLKCLLHQSVHVLDTLPPGYATGTITGTANTLQLGISEKLGVFVEFMSTIVAAIVVAFTWSWRLTLVTSSLILFIVIVVSFLLPFINKAQGRQAKVRC